uniref:Uncharacterized protein n=1 Tax=Avena sativa TaxID=4498 RepID=A0ACD5ZHF2_AVESA
MSIPPDSPLRGCAAAFPQPVTDELAVGRLVQTVSQNNRDIIYRNSGDIEHDITHHVFRWNMTPYSQVFENGFEARPQGSTPDNTYFNLEHFVNDAGSPLDPSRPVPHIFISTTLSSSWRPNPSTTTLPRGEQIQVYRYEIYAPGGIWVRETLGNQYQYPAQDEVSFVRGIAPQYIRSAQLYIATRQQDDPRYVTWRRADHIIRVNGHFNPQSHPSRMLAIQRPVFDYIVPNSTERRPLTISIWRPELPRGSREKRAASDNNVVDWYARGISDSPGHINAAFRSTEENKAYLFIRNEYVLIDYAPGTTDDRIVNGPLLICDGYPSLNDTAFGDHGIDCAFDTFIDGQVFIFSGNLCARIKYAPGKTDDEIINGPMPITDMFPFFKNTVFANSIDSAFVSIVENEAYLFKGDTYANINYYTKTCIAIRKITDGFYGLRDTIFQSGIEAAFASHKKEEHWFSKDRAEAYIFKGDQYALINYAPGATDDYINGGVKPIAPNWPSLREILPGKNRGLDDHCHHFHEQAHRDHEDL